MPIAPTPPTKPTPPIAPALTPTGSHTGTDHPPASSGSSTPNSDKTVSTGLSDTARKLDDLGKAFQGKSAQTKDGEKSAPAATTTNKTNSIQAGPAAGPDSQAAVSAQTAVPAKPPVVNSKPSGLNYFPFIGLVAFTAVILVGLRLFKKKPKQQHTLSDCAKKTATVTNKEGLDIVVSPQTTAPKAEKHFEVRV
ncbi:hypothetical protein SOV_47870 [Sporomusa ovata DSM 2662]|uniref:Uncharacterized protein n=1 Tax=Sporomusa ovata TaxID=2378 RepID=A0A0U1L0Z2_9FIRM|nr:hypothetical protein [Sporomusa ovata]EQB27164.1 hypothetical protein SOV_2c00560 [Sporomusa ovata DSM 2662]CQR72999.1 hypothetical protein SpAn4DRAFT_2231 [Sporomusa ovata]